MVVGGGELVEFANEERGRLAVAVVAVVVVELRLVGMGHKRHQLLLNSGDALHYAFVVVKILYHHQYRLVLGVGVCLGCVRGGWGGVVVVVIVVVVVVVVVTVVVVVVTVVVVMLVDSSEKSHKIIVDLILH